jgi:hypothetical protein
MKEMSSIYLLSCNSYHHVVTIGLQQLPAFNSFHPLAIIIVLQLLSFIDLEEEPKSL